MTLTSETQDYQGGQDDVEFKIKNSDKCKNLK